MELTKEMVDRAYAAVQAERQQLDDECLVATLAERERWLCAIRWCKEQYGGCHSLIPCQVLDRLCIAFTDERGSYTEGGLPMS
jgi:hypothetical protein